MILLHLIYVLRVAELTCAIVLLAMSGHLTFEYLRNCYRGPVSPGIVLGFNAACATFTSYRHLPQPIYTSLTILLDFLCSFCWFIIPRLLNSQYRLRWCYYSWWEAGEAISFIYAYLWLASAALGYIYHNLCIRNGAEHPAVAGDITPQFALRLIVEAS